MSVDWLIMQPGKNKKVHVQCAPHVNFLYSAVMTLSRCADVASLVMLDKKFTNSEEPMFITLFPVWHVLLVPLFTR